MNWGLVETQSVNLSANGRVRVLYSFPHTLGRRPDLLHCLATGEGSRRLRARMSWCFRELSSDQLPPECKSSSNSCQRQDARSLQASRQHARLRAARLDCVAEDRETGGQIDMIHTWPLGARETLKTAARLGIPTVLERPNANTRFAMDVVQEECERLGVALPPDHEHAYNAEKLAQRRRRVRACRSPAVPIRVCR